MLQKITYKKSDVIEKGKSKIGINKILFLIFGILLVTIMPTLLSFVSIAIFMNPTASTIIGYVLSWVFVLILFVGPGIALLFLYNNYKPDLLLLGCEEYESMRKREINKVNSRNERKAEEESKRTGKIVHYTTYKNTIFKSKELYNLLLNNDEAEYYDYHFDAPFTITGYSKPKEDLENDFEQYMEWDEMLDDD